MSSSATPAAILRQVEALVAASRLAEARAAIQAARDAGWLTVNLALAEAEILARDGQAEQALAMLARLIAAKPASTEPVLARAALLRRLGRAAEADAELAEGAARQTVPGPRALLLLRWAEARIAALLPRTARGFARPAPAAPVPTAAQVTLLRDEADIIGHSLAHHHALGVRNFLLVDNGSRDGSAAVIAAFADRHPDSVVCTITDRHLPFLQGAKTRAAVRFARDYFAAIGRPITWCLTLDADEFLDAPPGAAPLAQLLEAAEEREVIVLHHADAAAPDAAAWDGAGDPHGHFRAVRSHPASVLTKVFVRAATAPQLAEGNHFVFMPELEAAQCLLAAERGQRLVHLPMRSPAQLARKVTQGSAAIRAAGFSDAYAFHWHKAAQALDTGGDAAARARFEAFCRDIAGGGQNHAI